MTAAWPGDPEVDLAMDIESQLDLAAKLAPIDWGSIGYDPDEDES